MVGSGTAKSPARDAPFDRRLLLLGLVPVAVYLLFSFVVLPLAQLRPIAIAFPVVDAGRSSNIAALEAHYRYLWISAFLLSAAVSITVAISCALSLRTETPVRARRPILIFVTAATALVVAAEGLDQRWYELMGGAAGHGAGLYAVALAPVLWMLDRGLDLVKTLGAVALVLVATALILTLAPDGATRPPERRAAYLARALARQRTCLEQAAAVYVFALIAMLSWMYWPLPFLAGEATKAAYRQLVVGAAVLQGVGYSLGIAAIYLPPALLLRRRVAVLASAAAAGDAPAADDWLRARGLESRPLDQLRQLVALLIPTLVSLLPALKGLWQ